MHNGVEVIRTRRCSADGAAVVDTRIFDLTSTLIQRLERNRKISLFNPRVKFALRIMKFEAQCDPPWLGFPLSPCCVSQLDAVANFWVLIDCNISGSG